MLLIVNKVNEGGVAISLQVWQNGIILCGPHVDTRFLLTSVDFKMRALQLCPRNQVLRALSHRFIYASRRYATTAETLPRVAQPSFWHSIVPKFLRDRDRTSSKIQAPKSKEWNPATFYIVIFLLIGSNAIQMIALRNNFLAFSRKADAKIGLLKEVIERVQKGEDVDVKGLLGTGDKDQEREWEEGQSGASRVSQLSMRG